MRVVLHNPDFQAAESIWRSIDLLTRRLETGPDMEIVLYDITAEEIAADLSATNDLAETGLYQLLVQQPQMDAHQGPLSALIGVYEFDHSPPHTELLGRMAKIAAAARAPFVTGISVHSLQDLESLDAHPLIVETWKHLRLMPEAAYLGLTVPRFLLRLPYGQKTEPIDSFLFDEFTRQTGLKGMLWGNGSILAGLLLAQTFQQGGLSEMELGSVLSVDDIPFYYYTDSHGDTVALPCTERLIHERQALELKSSGFIPVLSMRGQPLVRLGGFNSVRGSQLAGPWAPLEIAESNVGDETDDLVTFDDEPYDDESHESEEAVDNELDKLLTELEESEYSDQQNDDDDMDPDLSQVLNDL